MGTPAKRCKSLFEKVDNPVLKEIFGDVTDLSSLMGIAIGCVTDHRWKWTSANSQPEQHVQGPVQSPSQSTKAQSYHGKAPSRSTKGQSNRRKAKNADKLLKRISEKANGDAVTNSATDACVGATTSASDGASPQSRDDVSTNRAIAKLRDDAGMIGQPQTPAMHPHLEMVRQQMPTMVHPQNQQMVAMWHHQNPGMMLMLPHPQNPGAMRPHVPAMVHPQSQGMMQPQNMSRMVYQQIPEMTQLKTLPPFPIPPPQFVQEQEKQQEPEPKHEQEQHLQQQEPQKEQEPGHEQKQQQQQQQEEQVHQEQQRGQQGQQKQQQQEQQGQQEQQQQQQEQEGQQEQQQQGQQQGQEQPEQQQQQQERRQRRGFNIIEVPPPESLTSMVMRGMQQKLMMQRPLIQRLVHRLFAEYSRLSDELEKIDRFLEYDTDNN